MSTSWIAWIAVAVVMVPLAIFMLARGEVVGSMECDLVSFLGTSQKVTLRIKRHVSASLPQVQVQVRATAMIQGQVLPQPDALQLALMLEEAARKADGA